MRLTFGLGLLVLAATAQGQTLPLPDRDVAVLAQEVDGDRAMETLQGIVQHHRERGSRGYHASAEWIAGRARAAGLEGVEILQFPADGKVFYGTQRSRPAWDVVRAELTEVDGGRRTSLASYAAQSMALAQDSESAELTAPLLDVGAGTSEADYAGKDARGKIVLVSASPGAAQDLAIGRFGAVGIVSYQQNQKTAWSGDNQEQVRWGHLGTFSAHPTFAFMVSTKTANALKARLAAGEAIDRKSVV